MFTSKLEPNARAHVLLSRPDTLSEAIAAALLYESAQAHTSSTTTASVNNVTVDKQESKSLESTSDLIQHVTSAALNIIRGELHKPRENRRRWQPPLASKTGAYPGGAQSMHLQKTSSANWVGNVKPALSSEERARYMEQRLCFNCGKPNHRAAECRSR